jgi:hypothetical protein
LIGWDVIAIHVHGSPAAKQAVPPLGEHRAPAFAESARKQVPAVLDATVAALRDWLR